MNLTNQKIDYQEFFQSLILTDWNRDIKEKGLQSLQDNLLENGRCYLTDQSIYTREIQPFESLTNFRTEILSTR